MKNGCFSSHCVSSGIVSCRATPSASSPEVVCRSLATASLTDKQNMLDMSRHMHRCHSCTNHLDETAWCKRSVLIRRVSSVFSFCNHCHGGHSKTWWWTQKTPHPQGCVLSISTGIRERNNTHTYTHTHLLWMSICSLVFVVVVLVTGETVEACIFSNNLHRKTRTHKNTLKWTSYSLKPWRRHRATFMCGRCSSRLKSFPQTEAKERRIEGENMRFED